MSARTVPVFTTNPLAPALDIASYSAVAQLPPLGLSPKSEGLLDTSAIMLGVTNKPTQGAFTAEVFLTVLVSGALFMVFIMAFFFLLTRNVEKKVVSTSVQRVVNTLCQDVKALVPASVAAAIGSSLQTLQAPDTEREDAQVEANNTKLVKKTVLVLGCTLVGVVAIALAVFFGMRAKHRAGGGTAGASGYPNPVHVLLTATMGFVAVGFCELVFLYGVAARYQPLDASATKRDMLQALITAIEKLPQSP